MNTPSAPSPLVHVASGMLVEHLHAVSTHRHGTAAELVTAPPLRVLSAVSEPNERIACPRYAEHPPKEGQTLRSAATDVLSTYYVRASRHRTVVPRTPYFADALADYPIQ